MSQFQICLNLFLGSRFPKNLPHEPEDGVVKAVDDTLFQGDNRVVGDVDVFGADFGTAFGDVAESGAEFIFNFWDAVFGVQRVHFERRQPDHKPRAHEFVLAFVVAQDVTDILTQETFDAFAEFLDALHVALVHAVLPVWIARPRFKWGDALILLEIPGDIGHQVFDDRKRFQRLDRDGFSGFKIAEARHTAQPRLSVDFHTAGSAFAGFAVPAGGQIRGLTGLDAMNRIQDHHPGIEFNLVFDKFAALGITAPDFEKAR